jgi:hypothetical protein
MFAIFDRMIMLRRMKGVIFFSLMLVLFALGACSVADQEPNAVGRQFQAGLQGQGRIVPNDPTSDSFGPEYR